MHDLVIRAATIVDGTGAPGVRGDVAIDGDTISEIGRIASTEAHRTIDADGLTLAPGFIDMHAHSDLVLLDDPEHRLKTRMGVTTELLGQDGLAYAPGTTEAILGMRDMVAGINGAPDIDYDWTTVAGYLSRIEGVRPAVNAAMLVPHGTLRLSVLGMADRVATADERRQMAELADGGMRDGALGLSTGLTYPPGQWSDTREVTDICRAVAPYKGIYVTHHRDYGAGLIESVDEALAIGSDAGVPVHFSHFHISGKPWKDRAPELLRRLDAARESGQDVTLDAYPYLAGSTFLGAFLPDFLQGGSPEEIVARLRRPEIRSVVVTELDPQPKQVMQIGWDVFAISSLGKSSGQGLEGRRLIEIAATRGVSIGELICDLLVENEMRVGIIAHAGNEENVRTHYEATAAEILEALPRVDAFVAGIGTGGTITGVGRRLKEANPNCKIVGVEPRLGVHVQGLTSLDQGFIPPLLDESLLDAKLLVGNRHAVSHARRVLATEGLFVGISSGAVMHAAVRVASRLGGGNVVLMFADGGAKYLSTELWDAPAPDADYEPDDPLDDVLWW